MENVDRFCAPGRQPDIADPEFDMFAKRKKRPNIKPTCLYGINLGFAKSFYGNERLKMKLSDVQLRLEPQSQAESQVVLLNLFLELPDFCPEADVEIQFFGYFSLPSRF